MFTFSRTIIAIVHKLIKKGAQYEQKAVFMVTSCINDIKCFIVQLTHSEVTAVAQWLRCCATNRKVAGSIPAGVIGIFH